MKNMLDHALWYVRNGYSVFPVGWDEKHEKRKKPLFDWKTLQTRIATEEEIKYWWAKWPDAGIGMATGKLSGVIVLDAEHNADFSTFSIADDFTPTSRTGGGGKHYFFKYEEGIGNATRIIGDENPYDIRGEGGYVLVAPSLHESGNHYEWLTAIGDVDIQPLPESVRAAYKNRRGGIGQSNIAQILQNPTKEGSRNNNAASVIGKTLLRFKPQEWESEAWPLVTAWNKEQNKPPLDEQELKVVFESVAKKEASRRAVSDKGTVTYQKDTYLPEIEEKGETVIVRSKVEDGIAVFLFSEIEQNKSKEIEVLLTVELQIFGSEPRPFDGRLNILSMSSREGFARQLGKSFGKNIAWELLLASAATKLRQHLENKDYSVCFADVIPEETNYLMNPYLVDGASNVIFGMGSSGKTFIALRIALSCATGITFLDSTPEKTTNILYIDYESTAATLTTRLMKLSQDKEIKDDPRSHDVLSHFFYFKPKASIPDSVPVLKKLIEKHQIGLVVVDSAVPACGGKPEDADTVGRFFNALAALGVANLVIAHETKAENKNHPFGSIFFYNFPRNIWNVQRTSEPESSTIISSMHHRKANDDSLKKDRALKICFDQYNIDIVAGQSTDIERTKSISEQIVDRLKEGPKNLNDLYRELKDIAPGAIRSKLSLLEEQGKVGNNNGLRVLSDTSSFLGK